MEKIIKTLIDEHYPKYDCLTDLLWNFTEIIDEDAIPDLLEAITFDSIMDYLDERNIYYKGNTVIDVANLYILILTQEILKKDYPNLYSNVK